MATLHKTKVSRRSIIKGIGAGVGASSFASFSRKAWAQTKSPVNVTLWTNDDAAQVPIYQRQSKLFMENNPHIRINHQWFPGGELGRKATVGFATGTAPEGLLTYDFYMPMLLDKQLLAPIDVQRLGYESLEAFKNDYPAFISSAVVQNGNLYAVPVWAHAYSNWINTKHFQEVGLDPDKDAPQTWEQFGEVAKQLTIKQGDRFVRQGAKFAMHSPLWTVFQFNPILLQCGGAWFDDAGKCTVNSDAGVRAMEIRASLVRRYKAEDPADSIATNPLPMMDWLKERTSMFLVHPIPNSAIDTQNPEMFEKKYYRAISSPGVEAGKGYGSGYGWLLTINAKATPDQQAALTDFYKLFISDPLAVWKETAPFAFASKRGGWQNDPAVTQFPNAAWILQSREEAAPLPKTFVFNELADAMHRAIQNVVLNNGDIQTSLDEAAAEIDRATAAYRRG